MTGATKANTRVIGAAIHGMIMVVGTITMAIAMTKTTILSPCIMLRGVS